MNVYSVLLHKRVPVPVLIPDHDLGRGSERSGTCMQIFGISVRSLKVDVVLGSNWYSGTLKEGVTGFYSASFGDNHMAAGSSKADLERIMPCDVVSPPYRALEKWKNHKPRTA